MPIEFDPTRSLIFVRVAREEYRHRLRKWLYHYHVADSIAQFAPYVTKYAYYPAFPTPPGGDAFGAHNLQLVEHYWMFPDPHAPRDGAAPKVKTMREYFPPDVLRWQGHIPDVDPACAGENMIADEARTIRLEDENLSPFVFAFLPLWWEEEFKDAGRTIADDANYRWIALIKYPDGVSLEEGDRWFYEAFIPAFQSYPETTRILTSKVRREVNGCQYQRCFEMWFDGPDEWQAAVLRAGAEIEKPAWASTDAFPYLKRFSEIVCMFLGDIAESNNMTQFQGYIPMR